MLQDAPNFVRGRGYANNIIKKHIVIGSLAVMRGVRGKDIKEGYV
jgi:hypothetical protein